MRFFLGGSLVALSVLCTQAARAAPVLGPEFNLDPAVFAGAPASTSSIAWDGTNYFVAYTTSADNKTTLRGTRVSPTGTVLDPGGITLAYEGPTTYAGGVGYGAGYFLESFTSDSSAGDVCGAVRVGSDGTVVDSTPIAIGAAGYCTPSSVTFDGTNFLVATTFYPEVSGALQPGAPATITISPTGTAGTLQTLDSNTKSASVLGSAFDGTHHLVLYSNTCATNACQELEVRQVPGGAGSIVTSITAGLGTPPWQYGGDVACDGATGCLVVWLTNTSPPTIRGARIGLDASVLDATGFPISRNTLPSGTGSQPRVRWDGTYYEVVWPSGSSLLGARVTGNTLADSADIVLGSSWTSVTTPAMASSASGSLLTWEPSVTTALSQAVLVDGTLTAQGSSFPFALTPPVEQTTTVGSNGSGYLVVWSSGNEGGGNLLAARIDATGTILDVPPLVLSSTFVAQSGPVIASANGGYLVTWEQGSPASTYGIYGALVPPSGSAGTPFEISPSSPNTMYPAVAASSSEYLVAWSRAPTNSNVGTGVFASRVSTAGAVLDPIGIHVSADSIYGPPIVASDGTDYVVAFPTASQVEVSSVASVAVDGGPLADGGSTLVSLDAGISPTTLSFAYTGGAYLAGWNYWTSGASAPTEYASLLTAAGTTTALDPLTICAGAGCGNESVASVGAGYYAVWFSEHPSAGADTTYDMMGASIATSGVVSPPNGALLADTSPAFVSAGPILAASSAAQGLIVYNSRSIVVGSTDVVYRARARLISFDADDAGAGSDAGTGPDDSGAVSSGGDATVTDATTGGGDATIGTGDDDATTGTANDATTGSDASIASDDATTGTPDASTSANDATIGAPDASTTQDDASVGPNDASMTTGSDATTAGDDDSGATTAGGDDSGATTGANHDAGASNAAEDSSAPEPDGGGASGGTSASGGCSVGAAGGDESPPLPLLALFPAAALFVRRSRSRRRALHV